MFISGGKTDLCCFVFVLLQQWSFQPTGDFTFTNENDFWGQEMFYFSFLMDYKSDTDNTPPEGKCCVVVQKVGFKHNNHSVNPLIVVVFTFIDSLRLQANLFHVELKNNPSLVLKRTEFETSIMMLYW